MPDLLELNRTIEPKIQQLKRSLAKFLEQRLISGKDLRELVPSYYKLSYAEDFDEIQNEIIERILSQREEALELSHLIDSEIGTAGGMVNLLGADGVVYFSIPLEKFDFLTDEDRWVFAVGARRGLIDDLLRIRASGSDDTENESKTVSRAIESLHGEIESLLTGDSEQLTNSQPTIEDYLQIKEEVPSVEVVNSQWN